MDELMEIKRNDSAPTPSYTKFVSNYQAALKLVDDLVLKNYVSDISNMDIVPLSEETLQNNISKNVDFFKVTEMVYEKDEPATYKFASVFNALPISNSTIFVIMDSDGFKTNFYMGVRSLDKERTITSLKNTVENAIKGQFPGTKTVSNYTVDEINRILDGVKAKSVSAVSCVANNKLRENASNQSFVQGLEKLVLSMQGKKYTGIVIANGTPQAQLRELRKGYETIYTQLSAFATAQINYTNNSSSNYSVSESEGSSQSKSHSVNLSESETTGSSKSHSESPVRKLNAIACAASSLGMALAPFTGAGSMIIGSMVSTGLMLTDTLKNKNETNSTSTNESKSKSVSNTTGTTDSANHSTSKSMGKTEGDSKGTTLTFHDKSIENTLERIDKQLKRINEFESLGMYECAAYFLSDDPCSAEIAASTYKSIMRGENSGVEVAAINSWGDYQQDKTEMIAKYVKNFIHPVFKYEGAVGNIEVTPCSLVSGNELAIHMGLPRRSVCGLPVIEHADFGKEIVTYNDNNKNKSSKEETKINLGKIFNMGSEVENSKVTLNTNSLTMHTFVTGSTGCGKSNTIYEMLRQIDNLGLTYMVIEPAKGEYKNVFGILPGVKVYGSNKQYTDILRINPFKFPKGVHILEHIDRLVEIFNVCWPMYAAMPAVLKDAVLQAYESCGWDLVESENSYSDELFPTFADLLKELIVVIQNSDYSEEVKSNYSGSLVTRIKSLTNGINGQIFSSNEIDNNELFDKKVIVDISRIGSAETKSLIMGILIMRLSEHRMSNANEMNSPLRHVTILEEAHNILKRTSTEQNEEGSNVAGKSVEMISNAIAEMRTYGEGFIIADQSPSAVDISAIRNTNTKIIMRLPDEQDRRLAGKSAGLKDNQLDEIAKLPKGVAVVYQNDWIEPVLCKIGRYSGKECLYQKDPTISDDPFIYENKKMLVKNLLHKNAGEKLDMTIGCLTEMLLGMEISTNAKIKAIKAFRVNGKCSVDDIRSVIYDLICNETTEKEAEEADSIEEWKDVFVYAQDSLIADLDPSYQNMVIECILREQIERYDKPVEYLDKWKEFLKTDVIG